MKVSFMNMEQVMVSAMIFKIQVTRNWQFWFQIIIKRCTHRWY